MSFERIYYQGKEMRPDTSASSECIFVAKNKLHRLWLRVRYPSMRKMKIYIEKPFNFRDFK